MNEVWKIIENAPLYKISSDGRVEGQRGLLRLSYDKDRYLKVVLCPLKGRKQTARVHRLVAEAFIPNPENKPQVNHINGIKTDNRVGNLEWCTASENERHSYDALGKQPRRGILHPSAKLTDNIVREIRRLKEEGLTAADISEHLGLNVSTVCGVYYGEKWRHVK